MAFGSASDAAPLSNAATIGQSGGDRAAVHPAGSERRASSYGRWTGATVGTHGPRNGMERTTRLYGESRVVL